MNPVDLSFRLFPGGSLGEFNLTRELSTVLSHGKGSKVYDVFGKEFIDYSISWGSVILGHSHPTIIKAVKNQVEKGSSFSYVTEQAPHLAEELNQAIPCAEKVRFAASGTEATFYAIRFARSFTGKTKVVKFEGAYHGAHDIGVTSLFPQSLLPFPKPEPTSAGISKQEQDEVLIAPYNDLERVMEVSEKRGVLVSRVRHSMPCSGRGIPPRGVAPPSSTPSILGRRALRSGRRAPDYVSPNP